MWNPQLQTFLSVWRMDKGDGTENRDVKIHNTFHSTTLFCGKCCSRVGRVMAGWEGWEGLWQDGKGGKGYGRVGRVVVAWEELWGKKYLACQLVPGWEF